MADDSLSTDEINALLSGIDNTLDTKPDIQTPDFPSPTPSASSSGVTTEADPKLNLPLIKEAIKKTLTEQAKHVSTTYNKTLDLTLEDITLSSSSEISTFLPFPVVIGTGKNVLYLLSTPDAIKFVDMITGTLPESMDANAQVSLQALLNQFGETTTQTLSDPYSIQADLTVSEMASLSDPTEINLTEPKYLAVKCAFKTDDGMDSHYYQLYVPSVFSAIQAKQDPSSQKTEQSDPSQMPPSDDPFGGDDTNLDSLLPGDATDVKSAEFMPLSEGSVDDSKEDSSNIGLLLDVPMEVTVELGRSTKSIKEILSLGEGSIIELDKLAGEPVDLLVNRKPIAKGEVVVIDENFGVRVTEIISPKGRMDAVE